MSGRDPYEAVLNLAPGPRPPNHYVLLGLKQFETNQAAIVAAADARTAEAVESVLASAAQIHQV
ncbi:MAG TPA: hypothetical protein VMF30_03390, partial [Pirellulales bacterium]|nr:hypothetical protein [Pirellulales bacterium]